ncbi:MAG TPA: CocE/NonD family hydrolase, partial [Planctomycetota bacterium]|nr:CocE/NonD family hydrolase [Planctomycetota bacterium]
MRRLSLFPVLVLLGAGPQEKDALFDVVLQPELQVAMRDGIKLATDVYLPAREGQPVAGKRPVILVRTPYNKSGEKGNAEYFARRGYAFVAQDTRGRW